MATPAARAITSSPAKRAHARAPSFGAASASSAPSVTTGIGPVDGVSSAGAGGAAGGGPPPRPGPRGGPPPAGARGVAGRAAALPRVGDTAVLADGDVGH